jgi:uncharacterized protein YecT (DUF1311 family)
MRRLSVALAAAACLSAAVPAAAAGGFDVKSRSLHKSAAAYDISIEYPATGNARIDREIAGWAARQADDFVKLAKAGPHPPPANTYGLEITFEVARNDGEAFAVVFSLEMDTGGAHPNHDLATFNFEVPGGWRLFLPEIFDGPKALARISALAVADLTRQAKEANRDPDPDWAKNGASPDWDNFKDFVLQKDRLEIHYPDYQVAPYAEGEQETDLPLAALQGLMRSDRHAPVASFDCAVAATAVEKAVCSDVGLARLDRDVAEAFLQGVRYAAEDAARTKLKSDQRAWLGRRDAACPTAAVACLAKAYGDRLAVLKQAAE